MDFTGFKLRRTKNCSFSHIKCKNTTYSKLVWPELKNGVLTLTYYGIDWYNELTSLYTIQIYGNGTWKMDGFKQSKKPKVGELKAYTIHQKEDGYYINLSEGSLKSQIIDKFVTDNNIIKTGSSLSTLQHFLTRKVKRCKVPKHYNLALVLPTWDSINNNVIELNNTVYIKTGRCICCITKENKVYNYLAYTGELIPPQCHRIIPNQSKKLKTDRHVPVTIHNQNLQEILFCFKHKLYKLVSYYIKYVKSLSLDKLLILNDCDNYKIRMLLKHFDFKYLQSVDLDKFYNIVKLNNYGFPDIQTRYKYYTKYLQYGDSVLMPGKYFRDCVDYFTMYNNVPNNTLPKYPEPSKMKVYHDEMVKKLNAFRRLQNAERNAEYNKVYLNIKKDLDKLNYTFKDYTIFSPSAITDLLKEGELLHHCVGSYMQRVCTKTTRIFFLRKLSDMHNPYFTVEVDYSNTVRQCHTRYNQTIDKVQEYSSLLEFLQMWCKEKGLKLENDKGIM